MRVGEVVRAVRGRDTGRVFFVVGEENEFLLLADGRYRRLEKPKRKKSKHTETQTNSDCAVAAKLAGGEKVTDKELWRALAAYREG